MGQGEVFEFLREKQGKQFSSREVAAAVGVSKSSAARCLVKLVDCGMITLKKVSRLEIYYGVEE